MYNKLFLSRLGLLTLLVIASSLITACGETAALPPVTPTRLDAATLVSPTEPASVIVPPPPPTTNQTGGCVAEYEPEVDYFPEKVEVEYADTWTIQYFNNYKVIDVLHPWSDAEVTFQYVLVQCGTPAPAGFAEAQVIEVPINTIVALSTTYLPHLTQLDLLDHLVGVDTFQYVSTPAVRTLIEAGKLVEVGSGSDVNVERVISLEPDLVMTYGSGDPAQDAHPKLHEAGIPVAVNAEYIESSPLGRAEWIKFTAALFNHEAAAASSFATMAAQYNELAARVVGIDDRPTVFTNVPFQGTWYVPGGRSYVAQLLADAGAAYVWADDTSTGSLPLSFEAVYDRVVAADVWVNTGTWTTIAAIAATDERFADFAAVQQGRVYNNNARVNERGGNDYWESGVTSPHLILADLITIFHPELLPDHTLYFYQQLQ